MSMQDKLLSVWADSLMSPAVGSFPQESAQELLMGSITSHTRSKITEREGLEGT